jgi:hypothetical protein
MATCLTVGASSRPPTEYPPGALIHERAGPYLGGARSAHRAKVGDAAQRPTATGSVTFSKLYWPLTST